MILLPWNFLGYVSFENEIASPLTS
jgi:hypothetical protein